MKVLVVDDNAVARDILVATLDVEGYTVFTAADGEECLRCAERELPDVILLDVMMPDESGYEVCSRLRAMPRIRETSVTTCLRPTVPPVPSLIGDCSRFASACAEATMRFMRGDSRRSAP